MLSFDRSLAVSKSGELVIPPGTMTIPLDSYQFGFQSPVTLGSGGIVHAKASFDELVVHSVFNANSVPLFRTLTSGAHYTKAVLTQVDGSGHLRASWSLGYVFVTSDDLSGGSGALPGEELHFAFASIAEAIPFQDNSGNINSSAAAWNQVTNRDTSSASEYGDIPAPLAVGSIVAAPGANYSYPDPRLNPG
jgi:hypothetical protein